MNSIRCPRCGLLHWETDQKCKRCGCSFFAEGGPTQENVTTSADGAAADAAGSVSAQAPARLAPWLAERQPEFSSGQKKIGLAIFSLVAGVMSVPPLFSIVILIVGGVLALLFGTPGIIAGALITLCVIPTGLVTGIVAVHRVKTRPRTYMAARALRSAVSLAARPDFWLFR